MSRLPRPLSPRLFGKAQGTRPRDPLARTSVRLLELVLSRTVLATTMWSSFARACGIPPMLSLLWFSPIPKLDPFAAGSDPTGVLERVVRRPVRTRTQHPLFPACVPTAMRPMLRCSERSCQHRPNERNHPKPLFDVLGQ